MNCHKFFTAPTEQKFGVTLKSVVYRERWKCCEADRGRGMTTLWIHELERRDESEDRGNGRWLWVTYRASGGEGDVGIWMVFSGEKVIWIWAWSSI